MDPRLPPILPQSQIDRCFAALDLPAAPSLPWGEWLIALVGLIFLAAL
jgi:hypothetical protein